MGKSSSGWSSFLKALLLVGGALLVLVVIVAIAGVSWWRRNGKDLVEGGKAAMEQGQQEGRQTTEEGCIRAAAERAKKESSIIPMLQANLRITGCLSTAKISENLCTGIPKITDFAASTRWRLDKCAELNLGTGTCEGIVGALQQYCHSPGRQSKIEHPEKEP